MTFSGNRYQFFGIALTFHLNFNLIFSTLNGHPAKVSPIRIFGTFCKIRHSQKRSPIVIFGTLCDDSDISDALRTAYIGKKYSFNDSCMARHETFGPMIQQ